MMLRASAQQLGPAIEGTRRQWRPGGSCAGQVCYYVAEHEHGRPLVFVHDLRPTSSAYEMRPLFECFRWRRPTFAIDLPGFGLSERAVPSFSTAALADVLEELCRKLRRADLAADVVALGRGSELVARVARDAPGLVRSLVMLEPSGLLSDGGNAIERVTARLAGVLGERFARSVFALIATRPMVRRALRARFRGAPNEGLVEYAHAAAQVPNAHRVPLAALAAPTRRPGAPSLYHSLTVPVLVVHDAHGPQAVELEAFLRGRANRFALRVSHTRGMPQFERRVDTFEALDRFWQALARTARDQAMR